LITEACSPNIKMERINTNTELLFQIIITLLGMVYRKKTKNKKTKGSNVRNKKSKKIKD
jgi:hypothetical protein